MASTSSIINAMNNITLDDEEEGGLALEETECEKGGEGFKDFDTKLCLMGRFITEGVVDFSAMQQTLAALWRPGKGVYIKEIDTNLYLFQFYHELDIKRVCEGSPWSFNRKALIIARMKKGDIPRGVSLNKLELWVQIHDLRAGFMSEKVVQEVGNYIGEFVSSCQSNFKGVWREYLRVRVAVDLSKPLKRRMKVRRAGNDWFWIVFKYENVPTFCFICGVVGHSEKFCSCIFDTPEHEITKPYGAWMRAPFKKQTNMIGARWLRDGNGENEQNTAAPEMQRENTGDKSSPQNQGVSLIRGNKGGDVNHINLDRGNIQNSNEIGRQAEQTQPNPTKSGIISIENKKRRTGDGPEPIGDVSANTELNMGWDEDDTTEMDQDTVNNTNGPNGPKNEIKTGSEMGVRLSQ